MHPAYFIRQGNFAEHHVSTARRQNIAAAKDGKGC
jgi:hypothetical protein